jgi:phenylacetate-coenzyme A ligase PaaK-like adenylate-forming protein
VLERKDFYPIAEKLLRHLKANPPAEPKAFSLRATTGTTGQKPIFFPLQYPPSIYFDWYQGAHRALFCYGSLNARLFYAHIAAQDVRPGAPRTLLLDAADIGAEIAPLLTDFAPDAVNGLPSFIMRLAPHISEETAAGVRIINVGGEMLTNETALFLKNKFPNARRTVIYGAVEVGLIGTDESHLPLNQYHPAEGIGVSVSDTDERGVGDILVSAPLGAGATLVHYRVGDVGRVLTNRCACGKAVVEIVGRRGADYVRLLGAIIRREEFDRVAKLVGFSDYRAELSKHLAGEKLKGKIRLIAVLPDGVGTQELARQLAERFARAVFLTPTRTLQELVAEGLFEPLTVEFSATLPRTTKEVKFYERL